MYKLPTRLAGHEFSDERIDCPCILEKLGEPCRMTRAVLFEAKPEDVDKNGFAHTSYLSKTEYEEIVRVREAYALHCEKLMDALRSVCG